MRTPTYFKPWALQWPLGIRIALVFILATGTVQFVVFGMTQNYVMAYFGAEPQDVSFALQITYCGIVAALPFQFRFVRYFETRNMLATALLASILLSVSHLFVSDIYVFIFLRLLTGFAVSVIAASALTLIFSVLPPAKIPTVGLSMFFGTVLCSGVIIGILSGWVVSNIEWTNIYYYMTMIQCSTLVLVFLILNPTNNLKKYPLYQLDWTSATLNLVALVSFAYTILYGPSKDWFDDPVILCSSVVSANSFGLLLYRQSFLKRPYIHLDTFKSPSFYIGIILLILFYVVKDSLNIVYAYSSAILQWPIERLIMLALTNVAGIVLGIWIMALPVVLKTVANKYAFLAGFSLMLAYHLWMYFSYSSDISFNQLIIPVFLQGTACGVLFVPIVRFVVSTAPMYTGVSATVMATMARFASSVISISAFFSMQRYYNLLNKQALLRNLTDFDQNFTATITQNVALYESLGFPGAQARTLAFVEVSKSLAVQSQLRSNMNVFMIMICILILLLAVICFAPPIFKLGQSLLARKDGQ
ncbi:MFS transporter, DHA2 family, multidrug resistance protein [Dyadobacter soli]|uniref:MFS transporter, DHA2 family, multidrug resistance protein n=1 Tax=Dyadobacter soli TaxID=659014 RepID=A0A1G6VIX0_9BACT|nr:MFS transporter [Dyadobacter soli]SDD53509.1 MFS transporter, DHA2 family, multidrug resistance protein [Dyadobacter soli]